MEICIIFDKIQLINESEVSDVKITFAKDKNNNEISLLTEKLNQHGLICGATGTGKTVTLKVLTEMFSDLGIPVILSDVKGDLTNLINPGKIDGLENRLKELEIENHDFSGFPVELWDVYGEHGIPLRVCISEMGPILLSQILELNDTQQGVLNIAFRIADSEGLLLLDLKDLKSILRFISDNRVEISKEYGNVSTQSISAIQRKVLLLEDLGGDFFFNEPSLEIRDLIREDSSRKGIINIINSKRLIGNPTIYAMFLLWLLSELYEELPEVGNPEFPKLIFFFDEAHLLFNNASKSLLNKILQIVRLIRSKGVGIFFVTQNPTDIPDDVSSQLATKIVHQLRAFSPREQRSIREISQGMRQNPAFNLEEEIQGLRTGEAIITTLDESGSPTVVEKGLIYPPKSSFEVLSDSEEKSIIRNSKMHTKYDEIVDRESAYEILQAKMEEEVQLVEIQRVEFEKVKTKPEKKGDSVITKMFNSALYSFTRQVGREIARGVFGTLKKK